MGYSYDYGYGYSGPDEAMMEEMMMEMMGSFGMMFAGVILMVALVVLAVSVAMYVFRSLGLHAIARRRGIRNAWMVWIPILREWSIGSLSDQYQYVVKGKVRNKRVLLLVLAAACAVFSMVAEVIGVVAVSMSSAEGMVAPGGVISLLLVPVGVVLNIVYAVFYYIAMYDLYTSCSPQNNVLFLVLSIIFPVTEPFFLFFNRHKDAGMPPRREAPQLHIPEPIPEPWETVNQE